MPIENRNLEAGTRLVAVHKRQTYTCEVQGDPPAYVLENGMSYKSPSAAAMAITETSTNGWRFWSVAGVEAPASTPGDLPEASDAREPYEEQGGGGSTGLPTYTRTVTPKTRSLKLITRTPNQKGVQDGFVRIFCRACMDGHVVAVEDEDRAGGPLEVCPRGHRQDDQALTGAPAAGVA